MVTRAFHEGRTTLTRPSTAGRAPVSRRQSKQLVETFIQAWLPKLLQQQEDAVDTAGRLSDFGDRVSAGVSSAESQLSAVMDGFVAAFAASKRGKDKTLPGASRPGSRSGRRSPELQALLAPAHLSPASLAAASQLLQLQQGEGLPEDLAAIVADIQATNQQLREVEQSYEAVDCSLHVLQEGAEQRDQQTEAYRDALLQLAEDLEAAEREEQERRAEAARREAEEQRRAAEARRAEEARREEQLRQELDALVAAASAVQATQAGLAVAETGGAVLASAPPISVEVRVKMQTKLGQQVMLVGNRPALGSWCAEAALPMCWNEGHIWTAAIEVPAAECQEPLEYKAVLRSGDKVVWEKGLNHTADLAGSCDVSLYHVFQQA